MSYIYLVIMVNCPLRTCHNNLYVFYVKLGHVKYLHVWTIPDIVIANCMSWLLLEAGQEEGGTSITPPPPATTILPPLVIWFTSGKDPPYLQLILFNLLDYCKTHIFLSLGCCH